MSAHQPITRANSRMKVLLRAYVSTGSAKHDVRVIDLSARGARVAMQMLPANIGDLLFSAGGVAVAGTIAWVRNGEVGVRFYRELTDEELRSITPVLVYTG